ncbi:MAG: potassium efflux system protein [Verrucomicrobiales bacterium]|jgi:potassium efflux system protein
MRLDLLIFLILSRLFTLAVFGQEPAPDPPLEPIAPPVVESLGSVDEIEAKVAGLAEDDKSPVALALRSLLEQRKEIDVAAASAKSYAQRTANIQKETGEVQSLLASLPTRLAQPATDPDALPKSVGELELLVSEAQAKSAAAKARRQVLEDEAERRVRRLDKIPELVAQERSDLAALETRLAGSPQTEFEQQRLAARQILLENTLAALEEEKKYYRAGGELLSIRRDYSVRESEGLVKLATSAQRKLDARRAAVAEQVADEAASRAKDKALPDALAKLARGNAKLAQDRVGTEGLVSKIARTNQGLVTLTNSLEQIDRHHEDVVEQVDLNEAVGLRLDQGVGDMLRDERRDLPRVEEIKLELRSGVKTLALARREFAILENRRRDEVSDLEGAVKKLVAEIGKGSEEKARILLVAKREHLDDLINDYRAYTNALVDTLAVRRDLLKRVQKYTDFIELRILWIRSAPALHASDFSLDLKAISTLFSASEWLGLSRQLVGDLLDNIVLWGLVLGILIYLIRYRRSYKHKLASAGDVAAKRNARVYRPTLEALLYTLLIAVPIPLTISFIFWRSSQAVAIGSWGELISGALQAVIFPTAALAIARGVCRPRGLLQCHLGLPAPKAALLYKAFSLAMLFVIPLTFLREGFYSLDFRPASRVCFIFTMLVIAVFAFKVLRPSVGLMAASRKTLWEGCAYPVYLMILGIVIGLGLATYLGYYYTVGELVWRIRLSIWLVLAVILVSSVVMRLLIISRRRVAFAQRLAAFRAAQAEREKVASGEEAPGTPNIAEIEADLVDITLVKEQTQALIRMTATLLIVFGLWGVWVEVAPSLKVFDGVKLWSTAPASTASVGDGDASGVLNLASGESAKREEVGLEKIVPNLKKRPFVSLADLFLSIITLFVTYFAARNIPGLLEITVLQRLKLKPGGSYTATTVVRYIIVLVGIITAFAYVDITWGKVQWIAAAITLGIGFGLQEVFANFVAGLILLFERPIRLGDFITVGGVNGTVTQIRMRATTIRDRGNKELLVPNKEFITGQLVNWTLTDVVNRIEIPVGIAYGSDTELARKLLLEVAKENKIALKDPAPAVVFSAFGASSLDFELRVFIRGADDLVRAASDLHFAVDKIFRENEIEIAFPQQDLHIRTVPEGMLGDLKS